MKELKLFLQILLLSMVVFFVAGAAINVSFNLTQWTEESREAISAFWLFVVVIIGIFALVIRGNEL